MWSSGYDLAFPRMGVRRGPGFDSRHTQAILLPRPFLFGTSCSATTSLLSGFSGSAQFTFGQALGLCDVGQPPEAVRVPATGTYFW